MRKAKEALVGLRERKKIQTREAIVTAALDLFDRQGYDATTVEEIAEAANVSPRTFFRYFDSKVEVVMAPKQERDELGEWLEARPPDEGPIEAMRKVLRDGMGDYLTDNPTQVRQMRCMLSTASLQAVARDHFNEHENELAASFAKRLGLPEDALEAQIMASAIGATAWTVTNRWVAEGGPPKRLFEMLDDALDLLAKGLESPSGPRR
ncbi:MAG: TetR family transcriptional regulator [Acidimicrobiales bacterium]